MAIAGMAVAGDLVAGSALHENVVKARSGYSYSDKKDVVYWGRISGDQNEVREFTRVCFDRLLRGPEGLSLRDSNIYFYSGEAVQCVDIKTRKIHTVISRYPLVI